MSEPQVSAISFQSVSKAFDGHNVLEDVSFEIPKGEALCLMGRSGTGKSVTLKLMIGLTRPDQGVICIENENIVPMDEDGLSAVRKKIGFLFQSAALFDSFSLNDNLALPLSRFSKKSKQEIDEAVQKELDAVGLGDAPQNARRAFRRHAQTGRTRPRLGSRAQHSAGG